MAQTTGFRGETEIRHIKLTAVTFLLQRFKVEGLQYCLHTVHSGTSYFALLGVIPRIRCIFPRFLQESGVKLVPGIFSTLEPLYYLIVTASSRWAGTNRT